MYYITKTDLSIGPQLGSQMCQYASLYSISQNTKHKIVILKDFLNIHRGIKILNPFNLSCDVMSIQEMNTTFNGFKLKNVLFDEDVFNISPNENWDIKGLFHTYIYWDKYRKELLNEFKFKEEIFTKSKKYIDKIPGIKVSMHFRRTDYLTDASLNLNSKYYIDAYNIIGEKISNFTVVVFSDDIDWCKSNVIGDNIVYSENHSNYEDMCIMSLCDHNIIANSTFSWWGAYLNKNHQKIVVCPYEYVDKCDVDFINGNYFPKEWISIKTS
jgi:hypothetical protein